MLTAADILAALAAAREKGEPIAIVSTLPKTSSESGEDVSAQSPGGPGTLRILIGADGSRVAGGLDSDDLEQKAASIAVQMIKDDLKEITAVEIDGRRLMVEISRPPLELIVCGGGHVGRAVVHAARFLDFAVTVIDDRADFASRERFPDPGVQVVASDFVQALQVMKFTSATHVVIVTRGHKHDEICLREVVQRPARYIGMIGSRRRTTTIREHLRKQGVGMELLRRVNAPIGLDIGAQTPEEIALAIMSEIVMVRRGGTGAPKGARMLFKDGPEVSGSKSGEKVPE